MPHDVSPPATAADEALSGTPEPWEHWETVLVLASIGVGLLGLVLLGWLVTRFILP